jgi:hypothetical protein
MAEKNIPKVTHIVLRVMLPKENAILKYVE